MTDKINLSLLEILAVLVPGSLGVLLLRAIPVFRTLINSSQFNIEGEIQKTLVFFGASYFIGHVLFYLGSKLDELVYDKIKYLLKDNSAIREVVKKSKELEIGCENNESINIYKWSCAVLIQDYPAMYAEVERHQAASKFFRSMTVVMILFLVLSMFIGMCYQGLISIIGVWLSFVIYLDQRHKAITLAYEYLVTVKAKM